MRVFSTFIPRTTRYATDADAIGFMLFLVRFTVSCGSKALIPVRVEAGVEAGLIWLSARQTWHIHLDRTSARTS